MRYKNLNEQIKRMKKLMLNELEDDPRTSNSVEARLARASFDSGKIEDTLRQLGADYGGVELKCVEAGSNKEFRLNATLINLAGKDSEIIDIGTRSVNTQKLLELIEDSSEADRIIISGKIFKIKLESGRYSLESQESTFHTKMPNKVYYFYPNNIKKICKFGSLILVKTNVGDVNNEIYGMLISKLSEPSTTGGSFIDSNEI